MYRGNRKRYTQHSPIRDRPIETILIYTCSEKLLICKEKIFYTALSIASKNVLFLYGIYLLADHHKEMEHNGKK